MLYDRYASSVVAISDYYLDGPGALCVSYAQSLHQIADAIEGIEKEGNKQ